MLEKNKHCLGFQQIVSNATRIDGGLIDHLYLRMGEPYRYVGVKLYSPYYTALDQDGFLLTVVKNSFNVIQF